MCAIHQQQILEILERFSHKRQQETFSQFMDILQHLAIVEEIAARPVMMGTFFIECKVTAGETTHELDFFIPPTGGKVYRYTQDKQELSIYLSPDHLVEDRESALLAIAGQKWLAIP